MKGNEEILKDFLESILEIKIESLELDVSKEFDADFYDGKKSVIDVIATLSDGVKVNVEMQNDPTDYSEQRCLYYWSKAYNHDLKKGEDYKQLKKVICIWFLSKDKYKDSKNFESKWTLKCDEMPDKNYFDFIEFHVIELQKFRNDGTIKPSKKNFWLWFLDHTNKEMVELAYISNEKIQEAREQIERITADPELRYAIMRADIAEHDEASRRARRAEEERLERERKEQLNEMEKLSKEREKRINEKEKLETEREAKIEKLAKEKEIEIAKKLKLKGMNTEEIFEITNLDKETIEKL